MARAHFDTLLSRVGQSLGIANMEADADGYCLLQLDGRLELTIEFNEDTQSVILSAACGLLPETVGNQALMDVLAANFYWTGAGGATLSLHEPSRTLYLQYREPIAHLDAPHLLDLLHGLVMNCEAWTERLVTLTNAPADNAMTAPALITDPLLLHGMRV